MMNREDRAQLIGQKLLKMGFESWFRYMFYIIEGRPFIVESLHHSLFELFDGITKCTINRTNINVPPRSSKTTLAKYLIPYSWTINPRCNFIYTSYSQSLLTSISTEIMQIMEHPVYKAMYPQGDSYTREENLNPVDDFWAEYLEQESGKNIYSAKKITTYRNGNALFASIGAQITGYGCGIRNGGNKFTGALIIDDANKPADIRSQVLRERVVRYYEETLLSRLNNPRAAIINIQQRLHLEDLSGALQRKYNFQTLKKPLIEDGKCQLPSQYTDERLKELQANNYMFSAQYQQEPIVLGGAVIKREWFRYYRTDMQYQYKRILITADTAMKVKEHNDYSVFIVGAVTVDNKLHIREMVRGKWEAPDLKRVAVDLFERYKWDERNSLCCSGLYIEDKASGVGLIQELQRVGVPVVSLTADRDKLTRVESVLSYIESGQVMLPNGEGYDFCPELLDECEAFTRDDSHSHDDIVDTLVYNIQEALAKTQVSLLDYFMD